MQSNEKAHEGFVYEDPEVVASLVRTNELGIQQAASDIIAGAPLHNSGIKVSGSLGDGQATYIIEYPTAEGTRVPLLIRPIFALSRFREYYEQYPEVRASFPRLYTTAPGQGNFKEILVMEVLEGLHADTNEQDTIDYAKLIEDPQMFERLCDDMFYTYDQITDNPLQAQDIRPTVGHNIFFDSHSEHFRLFDVDTVVPSGKSKARKFLSCVEPQTGLPNDSEARYTMRMLRAYEAKYGPFDL